jgi:Mn-dependent DtxR family transcriptional regulator
VPLDVVTQAVAIIGRRGSGKTNTGVVVVEGVLSAGQQAIVLDPLDVWWGLKSSKSGKSAGYEVLLIGDPRKAHTDLPLEDGDGAAIADFLVDEALPAVLSTRHLSKSARRRFSADFLERFYHRKGDPGKDTPCLLAIDEASMVVPQAMREPEQARGVGAVEACVRQGRASGIGVMLIDQRPASVNKDVLTQVELMVAHQLTGPQDRKALLEWVRANDQDGREQEFMGSLASLEVGEAWFWSPAWLRCFERVAVSVRGTFDSSATPKAGEKRLEPGKVAGFDLAAIKDRLGASIERARANDPKVLAKRVRELEKALEKAQGAAGGVDEAEVQRRIGEAVGSFRGMIDAKLAELMIAILEAQGRAEKLARDELSRAVDAWRSDFSVPDVESMRALSRPPGGEVRKRLAADVESVPGRGGDPRGVGKADAAGLGAASTPVEGVNKPKQKILDALAWFGSVGIGSASRSSVAAMAGVSPRSSGYEKNLSTLRTMGLIGYPSQGDLGLTNEGMKAAKWPTAPATLGELHRRWLGSKALSGPQAVLLEILLGEGAAVSRDDLAARAGVSSRSSGFEKNVSRLSSLGLVRYPSPGVVELTELLFPAGLGGGR